MINNLRNFTRRIEVNIGQKIGLGFLVLGTILIVIWSMSTTQNGWFLPPGIVLAIAGFVIMYVSGKYA